MIKTDAPHHILLLFDVWKKTFYYIKNNIKKREMMR